MNLYKKIICMTLLLTGLATISCANSNNQFDLYIVPTVDQQLDSWLKIPSQLNPTIHSPERIYPIQPFALRVLFKGYARSNAQKAHITYDVQFFDPDGKPTADREKNLMAYLGSVKNANAVIINQQLLNVFFDESYPFGEYEIKIVAKDHQSSTTIARSEKIVFAPFEKVANFASFDFFSGWIKNYFRQPDPGKAIFGFMQFCDNDPAWLQNNKRVVAFVDQLLDDNPWIWGHLIRAYEKNPDQRTDIITLMAITNHPVPEISVRFKDEEKGHYSKMLAARKTFTGANIGKPDMIDALWGEFYVSGHLDPVKKIVRYLKPFKLSETSSNNFNPQNPEQAAFWSLVEHGQKVPMATKYATYLAEYGELDPENKIQLRLALEVIETALVQQNQATPAEDKKNPPSQMR